MTDETWDHDEKKPEKRLQGLGRGKPKIESNNNEPPTTSKWGSSDAPPPGFSSFRRDNNNNSSGNGFGSNRGGGGFGRLPSNQDNNSRRCHNCQQPGHFARECREPARDNRNNREGGSFGRTGGFNSGRNNNNNEQNEEKRPDQRTAWRSQPSNNDGEHSNSGNTGGFHSSGGGFKSGGDRASNNNQPRDSYNSRPQRDNNGPMFSSGSRNDRPSNDDSNPPGGSGGPRVERYIPPPIPTSEDDIFGEVVAKGENFDKYHRATVKCTPEGKVQSIEFYEEANLATQVLENIRRAHFEEPTPIQRYTIPCIQQQDDLVACAQTGSGKTAAFLLPIISNLLEYHAKDLPQKLQPPSPLCLIVSPTRELALQTEREARKFAFNTPIIPCSAIGGHDMFTVSDRLKEGCHILSATTGRLKDMVEKGRISLKHVKYFVLDEADRMLDTGFEPDIRKLEELGLPPKEERYTSMFSATFPEAVQRLARHFLRDNYIFLAVGTPGGANEDIAQTIEEVPQSNKKTRLFQLLEQNLKSERCLIFVETKRSADYIGSLLSQKELMSTTMHGDRTQRQRYEAVQDFTNGRCPILVATSVAARGLDFPLIGYVVNYDLPDTSDFYIHRIGRTGRAGHLGKSISFFDPSRESDRRIAPELVTKLTEAGQEVPPFLKQYANDGFSNNSSSSHTTDMRHNGNGFTNRRQFTAGPTGGSASAGAAQADDNWDR